MEKNYNKTTENIYGCLWNLSAYLNFLAFRVPEIETFIWTKISILYRATNAYIPIQRNVYTLLLYP